MFRFKNECIIRFTCTYTQELHKHQFSKKGKLQKGQIKNDGSTVVLKTVKREPKDILYAGEGEAECPYCALLHA